MIASERLRELLDYDPETGIFTWRAFGQGYRHHGTAGHVHEKTGYRYIKLDQKNYPAHALAFLWMTGERPPEVDHINLNRDDNRWSNLRAASRTQNTQNSRGWKQRKMPYKGIRLDKRDGYYYAQIRINGRSMTLPGRFDTPEEAHAAYVEAAKKHFGEFANSGQARRT